jgi:hypothetical protein
MGRATSALCTVAILALCACSSAPATTSTTGTVGSSASGASGGSSASGSTGGSTTTTARSSSSGSSAGASTGSSAGSSTGGTTGTSTGGTTGSASNLVAWIPDYYGQVINVLAGASTSPAVLQLPATCTPNSVVVNGGHLYVACSAGTGVSGTTTDQILIYGSGTVSSLKTGPGTTVTTPASKTITDPNFDSLIGMTFDSQGDLWIASYGNDEVLEISAASLASDSPASTVSLLDSPSSPVALAFDSDGSLWVTGQYLGGILLNFTTAQQTKGANANPRYCIVETGADQTGCQEAPFLGVEGLALFNGDVWVANNSGGSGGLVPGREIFDIRVVNGALSLISTYGSSSDSSLSPLVCPGGLFATPLHLWVNDESYGEAKPQCGAGGDVSAAAGGVFDFTTAQLGALASQTPIHAGVTGRPGFGGIFIQNDN